MNGSALERFRCVSELISIDEAQGRVLDAVRPLAAEDVPLAEALGRVLAEEVESAIDVPPFDSSAMDGYAVVAGPEAELAVVGESRAGRPAEAGGRPGGAIRISTGGAVPAGATAVVPLEAASEDTETRVRVGASAQGDNIRRAGEDVRAGSAALAELGVEERFWGVRLRPGKPTWFGTLGEGLVFGLPGNPVSAMVGFHLFVRPALRAMQGADPSAPRASATLDEAVPRHPT